ncbi:unnamed protein product, partial [Brachionus calyciflorus]
GVPIGSINEIIKFLELNLKGSFYDRQNLIEFLNKILVSGQFMQEFMACLSILESVLFKMELSKYRVNLVYVSQSDSFYKMAENNSEMSQLKFFILFKDYAGVEFN